MDAPGSKAPLKLLGSFPKLAAIRLAFGGEVTVYATVADHNRLLAALRLWRHDHAVRRETLLGTRS